MACQATRDKGLGLGFGSRFSSLCFYQAIVLNCTLHCALLSQQVADKYLF